MLKSLRHVQVQEKEKFPTTELNFFRLKNDFNGEGKLRLEMCD